MSTERTNTVLLFPQLRKLPTTTKIPTHLDAQALFKIDFVCGVIRIGSVPDFGVTLNGCLCRIYKVNTIMVL